MLWYGLWVYIYIYYILYIIYIYNNNLAKFNCTVSLCVLILLPRIRADLSETQTRSKGANRRSVHRPWPCQASASTSLCQNRNRREMSHHTPTRDSFTRVCRGWDGYGWIYGMYRYVISVHCKKWQNSRRRLTLRQTLYNRHSKIGKTRIARQVGAYRATNAWCSALVEHLQFGQLVGTNPSHFSLCTTPKLNLS